VRLAANIVLARLLAPHDFGTMSLVVVLLTGLSLLSDFGIRQAVIQNRRGEDLPFLDTAWTLQVARGALLWLTACALAAPFSAFYREETLFAVIPIVALTTLIHGFNSIGMLTASRRMLVKRIVTVEFAMQCVGSATMLVIASIWPTIWALVFGMLAGSITQLALSHLWIADRPSRFRLEPAALRDVFSLGKWIFLSTMLWFLASQSDRLIFGKLVPLDTLGIYSIAAALAVLPSELADRINSAVVFPAYSRVLQSGGDFRKAFNSVRRPLVAVGLAGLSMLSLLAPALIGLLYDDRYADAAWMLQLLLIGAAFRMMESATGSAVLAAGNARKAAIGHLAKVLIMPALIAAGFFALGFPGAVLGYSLSEIARYVVSALAVRAMGLSVVSRDALLLALAATVAIVGHFASGALAARGLIVPLAYAIVAAIACMIWATALAAVPEVRSAIALRRLAT
jgi:O-antigen/teichoic acid export membrane protein